MIPSEVLTAAGRARSNLKFLAIHPAKGNEAVSPVRARRQRLAIKLSGYDHQHFACRYGSQPQPRPDKNRDKSVPPH